MPGTASLGLDIGSVNVKLSLCDAGGSVLLADAQPITASPHSAVNALLDRLDRQWRLADIASAGVSGAGKGLIPAGGGWSVYSSSLALAAGVLASHPDARTIIQVGGQSSLVIRLQDGLRRPWQVNTNPLCAAGTGRFLEQQAGRLGISLDEFGVLASQCKGRPPRIAARCSVFAKSDLIHLQQKGVPVSQMLYALCESIARMVASLTRGPFAEPIYLAGGLAANGAFVRALDEVLSTRNGHPVQVAVSEGYLHVEARGAALLARGHSAHVTRLPEEEGSRAFLPLPPLPAPEPGRDSLKPAIAGSRNGNGAKAGYLGVDVGSTSTKAAIVDDRGHVLAKHYLMTAGRPIDAVKGLFEGLLTAGAGEIAIRGVGVTGSGRYLVGSFIGADLVKNEITAQTRAAAEIEPDADIIELGGQDSKLVLKRNGVVVDYQMNKACAAGTGSFIDELAELLGVSVKNGQFARLAFAAPHTMDLGTRCAAFMAQAVSAAQQAGAPLEVITASLAVAVARNYLSKVVANRKLGQKIVLTGAVFYNEAVVAAFRSQLPDKTLIVPEHKEVSGAIGAALLAREALLGAEALTPATGRRSRFKGFATVVASQPRLTNFTCQACPNNCAITRMQSPGEPATYYGSRCDRYDQVGATAVVAAGELDEAAEPDGAGQPRPAAARGREAITAGEALEGAQERCFAGLSGRESRAEGAAQRDRAGGRDSGAEGAAQHDRAGGRENGVDDAAQRDRAGGRENVAEGAAQHDRAGGTGGARADAARGDGERVKARVAAQNGGVKGDGGGRGPIGHRETLFDERARLLFRDLEPEQAPQDAAGPVVAIPRALLVYDYAPLLLGFLKALGARAVLSPPTDKQIMEQAVELSYTDSCFPLKLLHGHVAALVAGEGDRKGAAPFILYPSLLRLGAKDGDENQRYSCPLVQASPFIVRAALNLESRLLAPAIDLSRGPEPALRSLADAAVQLGFGRREGRLAAQAGLAAQERFQADLAELGARRLAEVQARGRDRLAVVLLARAYMSQDAGANLGIAEKLAQLGVTPLPLDFLPLASVDPKQYSDRPYWQYESKLIAAAALTAADPHLYGLALTNFGCGPNSFILRLVEDIMGSKPLGQLEIDEHAAEAGIVTRLEAFVDTIQGHARWSASRAAAPLRDVYRGTTAVVGAGRTLLLPRMAPHAEVLCAAFEACGARARVLPEPDERNLLYANQVTSGVECLPYRVSLGDFIRAHHEMNGDLKDCEGFMAGSYGPCRLGKYATEQMHALQEMGIHLTIRSTVSNSAYRDLGLGPGFERLAWQGIVAMDYLQKLLWRVRPYERQAGETDLLFAEYTQRIAGRVRGKENPSEVMRQATADFRALIDPALPRRPRVGINGEIFLRANRFSNSDLVGVCEAAGLEVVISPLGEWFKYVAFRNVEDAGQDHRWLKMASAYLKELVQERDERVVAALCGDLAGERELSTAELLKLSGRWLAPSCGSEAVLSLGSAIEWMEQPGFAGAISVMPHGCMPGGIVAAMSEKLSSRYGKPWINLTYDGSMETNNLARIGNFAEVIRFSQGERT